MTAYLAVVPAYNESQHIEQVVEAVKQFLPVLVVDDGSDDDTARRATGAGAEVLRQVPNQGKGAALRAGFQKAIEQEYEAVVTLDGDGQHDPREIGKFLQAYSESQADLVIGMRDFSKMPRSRRLANTLGRWLISWAMGQPIPDNQSGYRLLSRRLMKALLDSEEEGFEFEVEMLATCLKNNFKLKWVPISTIYAGEASHIHPIKHIGNYLRMVWTIRKMMHEKSSQQPSS